MVANRMPKSAHAPSPSAGAIDDLIVAGYKALKVRPHEGHILRPARRGEAAIRTGSRAEVSA